jgi:hypothetical protein
MSEVHLSSSSITVRIQLCFTINMFSSVQNLESFFSTLRHQRFIVIEGRIALHTYRNNSSGRMSANREHNVKLHELRIRLGSQVRDFFSDRHNLNSSKHKLSDETNVRDAIYVVHKSRDVCFASFAFKQNICIKFDEIRPRIKLSNMSLKNHLSIICSLKDIYSEITFNSHDQPCINLSM